MFSKANRLDLVEKEELESQLTKCYLPKQLTEEELNNVITKVINTSMPNQLEI